MFQFLVIVFLVVVGFSVGIFYKTSDGTVVVDTKQAVKVVGNINAKIEIK